MFNDCIFWKVENEIVKEDDVKEKKNGIIK
jgi:hypothetical protein